MVSKTVVSMICDVCGKENDLVDTHSLIIDGHGVETEACDKCWAKVVKALVPFSTAGRSVGVNGVAVKRRRRARVATT